jgi:RNA polymerase sigma-70 factor (ECF subfamily)
LSVCGTERILDRRRAEYDVNTLDSPTTSNESDGFPDQPADEFVHLFTRSQRSLYLFILGMNPNPVEAEEILQEANVVILSKYRQFQLGTNFLAWARSIAHFETLKFRERGRRDRHQFSDEFVRFLADEAEVGSEQHDERRRALMTCLDKLRDRDRELIQHRYKPGQSGKGLAHDLGRPANSVYQSLGRIRRSLLECVHRQLAPEAQP